MDKHFKVTTRTIGYRLGAAILLYLCMLFFTSTRASFQTAYGVSAFLELLDQLLDINSLHRTCS